MLKHFKEAGAAVSMVLAIACGIGLVTPWLIRFFEWYWVWVLS